MKRLSLVIAGGVAGARVLFVLAGFLRARLEEQRQLVDSGLPEIAYAAIAADPALRIYSLDPQQRPAGDRLFHGYRILREVTCSSQSSREDRRRLVTTDLRLAVHDRLLLSFEAWHAGIPTWEALRLCDLFECNEMHVHPPGGGSTQHGFGEISSVSPVNDTLNDSTDAPVSRP